MMVELKARKEKINKDLNNLEKIPENIAIEKGQTLQNIKITEQEKLTLEKETEEAEAVYEKYNSNTTNEIWKSTSNK